MIAVLSSAAERDVKRVLDYYDPLMQKLRYLDKLVDELAKGKKMEKILRKEEPTP